MEDIQDQTSTTKYHPIYYLFIILLFIIGVIAGYFIYPKYFEKKENVVDVVYEPFVNSSNIPDVITNFYKPPSMAISGNLKVLDDTVKIYQRVGEDWIDAATISAVLQEEAILVDESGSATVEFSNIANVDIGSLTYINFANLIPGKILFEQRSGDVIYTVTKPISIKSKDSLTSINSGILDFSIDPDTNFIYVDVSSGSAKFAFISNSNQTTVYDVLEGDLLIYNPQNTSVRIR